MGIPRLRHGKVLEDGQGCDRPPRLYAGRKAVILKNSDESSDKTWPYGHCVVAGIDRYPLKVQKNQGPKTIKKRTAIKPFMKVINHNHIMPTRYGLENVESLKSIPCDNAVLKNPNARKKSRKKIKEQFQERLTAGKNRWFFSKLRF